jgi:hypothetical protein
MRGAVMYAPGDVRVDLDICPYRNMMSGWRALPAPDNDEESSSDT